jgi:hypothetical protein
LRKEIFETINAWILNVCSGGRADSDSTVQSLDVAVQLAVVFRNVRVDSAISASGVALICDFVKGSIQALVDGTGSTSLSANELVPLTLCGLDYRSPYPMCVLARKECPSRYTI